MFHRYQKHAQTDPEKLKDVSLLQFATHWDWKQNRIIKRGSKGVLPYIVNIWPRFRPVRDNDELYYEKYCYARMILHHPFKNCWKVRTCLESQRSNVASMSAGQLLIMQNVSAAIMGIWMTLSQQQQ